jgi:hypothetical protein
LTQAYRLPVYFADDWLNAYYHHKQATAAGAPAAQQQDQAAGTGVQSSSWRGGSARAAVQVSDYRFLYLGPAGSWTPLHHDVLCSYSWSANVCGRKRCAAAASPALAAGSALLCTAARVAWLAIAWPSASNMRQPWRAKAWGGHAARCLA